MSAYVIAVLQITDQEGYDVYKQYTPGTVERYGGKFVARGSRLEVLEGEWTPNRVVIIQFESVERAQQWWASPEYEAIKGLRQKAAISSILIVEGLDENQT